MATVREVARVGARHAAVLRLRAIEWEGVCHSGVAHGVPFPPPLWGEKAERRLTADRSPSGRDRFDWGRLILRRVRREFAPSEVVAACVAAGSQSLLDMEHLDVKIYSE